MKISPSILLMAVLALPALAGCISEREGPLATIVYTAYDPATGEVIVNPTTNVPEAEVRMSFLAGSGQSGFGEAFEREVLKLGVNRSTSITVTPGYSSDVAVERVFGPNPATSTAGRPDFTNAIGAPSVGMTFEFPAFPFYAAVVEAFDNATVTYRITPTDGQRNPLPNLGATLVTYTDGASITQVLDPEVGATFRIASTPVQGAPLGLADGFYRTTGANATHIMYEMSAHPAAAYAGTTVRLEVRLVSLDRAPSAPALPSGSNYGARDTSALRDLDHDGMGSMPAGGAGSGHDDGHDHQH